MNCNATNQEFQGKDILATQEVQSNNENIQITVKINPLEKILNIPGLIHLAENIFDNLDYKGLEVYRNINQSSQQILDNPMFWLKKFKQLSNKNKKDWIKVIQSMNNSDKEKAIITYLQWNLKKDVKIDLPCYTDPSVQADILKKIWHTVIPSVLFHENTEIVKVLAPLADNPNAPKNDGETPIYRAAYHGHTKIVKILAPLTANPNAPDDYGNTPIHIAAMRGHIEIVKFLAPLTDNPNVPNIYGDTPISFAKNAQIRRILQ